MLSEFNLASGLLTTALLIILYYCINHSSHVISWAVSRFLCWRYHIVHQELNVPIPTIPYRWPNGQGDSGKFLEGIENSELWAKQHGTIYRIWSGMAPEIVLTRPEHLQVVFKDSNSHFKAANNDSGYLMSQLLGQCLGLISGAPWRAVRSLTEAPFQHNATRKYVTAMERRTRRYLTDLNPHGQLSLIDPAEDLKMLPFWIVAEIVYGELPIEMEEELKQLAPVRERLFRHVICGGLQRFSWSRFLPTEANRLLRDYQRRWASFNQRAYARAVAIANGAPIIGMFQAVKQHHCSAQQLLQTLDEMLYANLDVTTGGISWNLVFLAAHLPVQERLRAEVADCTDSTDRFEAYVQSSSSYLAACISESARLRPLAAFSVPQSAPTERLVGGFMIPARVNFIVDSYALNVRNEYWGSDRTMYRPERFLGRKTTETRYNYWRFGFGPRNCLGKHVADLIIRVLLVHLLQSHRLALIDDEIEWPRNEEMWITHPKMKLKCSLLEGH